MGLLLKLILISIEISHQYDPSLDLQLKWCHIENGISSKLNWSEKITLILVIICIKPVPLSICPYHRTSLALDLMANSFVALAK